MSNESKRERSDAVRNRRAILEATDALLAEFGADNVSIEQIAAAAHVSKGTIFHRFGNRAGLMRALVFDRATALRDAVVSGAPPLGPGAPAADRLLAYFDAMFRLVVDNVELMIAYDDAAEDPHAEAIHAFWYGHIAALLSEARPDADAEVLSRVLLSSVNGELVLHHIRTDQTERLAETIHDLVESVVTHRH
ncbi:TetR/AcrR family transcriptional regulator [Rhodococcus spelaei]|uniref:TetR/AcrR family transcriptional regulator n=1 Tax=Rhodococcus spelaei TaxID=2546320 RepID=A0A541BPI5_9NOCA|nr:TetR/AcrR family transcriptional regulator [Rhodococcus spelaei]TQF74215.1 TetR/AcrR family transcriptional regulator [Rhodococcus spelaei]